MIIIDFQMQSYQYFNMLGGSPNINCDFFKGPVQP